MVEETRRRKEKEVRSEKRDLKIAQGSAIFIVCACNFICNSGINFPCFSCSLMHTLVTHLILEDAVTLVRQMLLSTDNISFRQDPTQDSTDIMRSKHFL